jgi:hypothetical protein
MVRIPENFAANSFTLVRRLSSNCKMQAIMRCEVNNAQRQHTYLFPIEYSFDSLFFNTGKGNIRKHNRSQRKKFGILTTQWWRSAREIWGLKGS